jgi:hypothetical protein
VPHGVDVECPADFGARLRRTLEAGRQRAGYDAKRCPEGEILPDRRGKPLKRLVQRLAGLILERQDRNGANRWHVALPEGPVTEAAG